MKTGWRLNHKCLDRTAPWYNLISILEFRFATVEIRLTMVARLHPDSMIFWRFFFQFLTLSKLLISKVKRYIFKNTCKKVVKIFAEKFGSKEKSRTFALPFEKRGSQPRRNSTTSSLKRLIYCTRSKYRENTIYREALISLEIISVSDKLRII